MLVCELTCVTAVLRGKKVDLKQSVLEWALGMLSLMVVGNKAVSPGVSVMQKDSLVMGRFQAKYLLILAEMTVLLCTQYMVHKRVDGENRARYCQTGDLHRFSSF